MTDDRYQNRPPTSAICPLEPASVLRHLALRHDYFGRNDFSRKIDAQHHIIQVMNIGLQTLVDIGSMIERTSGIKGGTPHIAGTGVTVRTIVRWYKLGMAPDEIAAEIPNLNVAQVYAALTHYHANRDQMEVELAAEEAESDRLEREYSGKS